MYPSAYPYPCLYTCHFHIYICLNTYLSIYSLKVDTLCYFHTYFHHLSQQNLVAKTWKPRVTFTFLTAVSLGTYEDIREQSFSNYVNFFQETNIFYLLIHACMRAYQWVRNVSFLDDFVYVLNWWHQASVALETLTKNQRIENMFPMKISCS